MGAVAQAVEDVASGIGDVVQSVGNVVSDVANTAVHIVEQAGRVVEKTVDAALKDPVGTIAKAAAIATQQYYLLPLISATSVLANGGNFEDAARAGAIGYVTQGVAQYIGGGTIDANADFVSYDAQQMAAQGLSRAQIADVLGASGVNAATALAAATAASEGLGDAYVTQAIKQSTSGTNSIFVDAKTQAAQASGNIQQLHDISQATGRSIVDSARLQNELGYTADAVKSLQDSGFTQAQINRAADLNLAPDSVKLYVNQGNSVDRVLNEYSTKGNFNDLANQTPTAAPASVVSAPVSPAAATPTADLTAARLRTNWSDLQPRTFANGETVYYSPSAYNGDGGTVSFDPDGTPRVHGFTGDPVDTGAQVGTKYTPSAAPAVPVVPETPAGTVQVQLPDGSTGNYNPATGTVTTQTGTPVATTPVEPGPGTQVAGPYTPAQEAQYKQLTSEGRTPAEAVDIIENGQPAVDTGFRVDVTGIPGTAEVPQYAINDQMTPGSQLATRAEIDAGTARFNQAANAWEVTAPAAVNPVQALPAVITPPASAPPAPAQPAPAVPTTTVTPAPVAPPVPVETPVVTEPVTPAPVTTPVTTPPVVATPVEPAPVQTVVTTPPVTTPPVTTPPVTTLPVVATPVEPAPLKPVETTVIPPNSSQVTPVEATPPAGVTTDAAAATAGYDPATIAKWVAAGLIAKAVLAPTVPTGPTYGPLPPVNFGTVGQVNLPGLNPGMITNVPRYYNNSSPVAAQFYYGQHPYQAGQTFDPALYNTLPVAPATPFGLQQMYNPATQTISNLLQGVQQASAQVPYSVPAAPRV